MDIVLVEIPKNNGYEQYGLRPALLLSKPIEEISIIIPFTSNILSLRFDFTLKIEPTLENGLTFPSVLLIFQIRAIDSKRIKNKIGVLDKENYSKTNDSIKKMLKLL